MLWKGFFVPKIEFTADAATVTERMSDRSYKVTLSTGEYTQQEMAKILLLPKDSVIKVTLEVES